MLSKLSKFVQPEKIINKGKEHQEEIILFVGVILVSLFSFAMGYILASQHKKPPIKFEKVGQDVNFKK